MRIENPRVGGSNPPPGTIFPQVISVAFSLLPSQMNAEAQTGETQ